MDKPDRRPPSGSALNEAFTFGGTLALSSIGGLYLGKYLDGLWHTAPWLAMGLPVLAILGSFYRYIRRISGGD